MKEVFLASFGFLIAASPIVGALLAWADLSEDLSQKRKRAPLIFWIEYGLGNPSVWIDSALIGAMLFVGIKGGAITEMVFCLGIFGLTRYLTVRLITEAKKEGGAA